MPYSVTMPDDADKARPDVFNVLLQALDDSPMPDRHGPTMDFKNTVAFMAIDLDYQMIQRTSDNA